MGYDTGGQVDRAFGDRLQEEGTFHVLISKFVWGETSDIAFDILFSVFTGTVKDQENKFHSERFFKIEGTAEQIERTQRQYNQFFIAAGLLTHAQVKANDTSSLDGDYGKPLANAQLFITTKMDKAKKYLNIWDNFYHIDDPAASKFPRRDDAIQLIETSKRRPPAYWKATHAPAKSPDEAPESSSPAKLPEDIQL
jgi:hypothetical protein